MADFSDPTRLAREAADAIRDHFDVDHVDVGLVLGSGWSAAADTLGEELGHVALADLPGFSKPVVAGHGGAARLIRLTSQRLALVLTGRTHYYEGRGTAAVVHGVRTIAALGATRLVLTNGCGGLRPEWGPGTVVALSDHLNLTAATPLRGATFVDMTHAYSPALRALLAEVAPGTPEGVYAQFPGPQYETPAEVRMARILGADLVGMSTALETIAAREAGLEVLGLSLVTNHAAGTTDAGLDHSEVIAAGKAAVGTLQDLLRRLGAVL